MRVRSLLPPSSDLALEGAADEVRPGTRRVIEGVRRRACRFRMVCSRTPDCQARSSRSAPSEAPRGRDREPTLPWGRKSPEAVSPLSETRVRSSRTLTSFVRKGVGVLTHLLKIPLSTQQRADPEGSLKKPSDSPLEKSNIFRLDSVALYGYHLTQHVSLAVLFVLGPYRHRQTRKTRSGKPPA